MNHRLFAMVVSMLVAVAALTGAVPAPVASISHPGPLPECRYDDVMTPLSGYRDWRRTLLDTTYMVSATYVPPRLVSVRNAGIGGRGKVRRLVLGDLREMAAAARSNGTPIAVVSAYRSYARQATIYNNAVDDLGEHEARKWVARPGHSEHQLGTSIDFRSGSGGLAWKGSDWGASPAGKWMKQNAWQYGFVMSYPKRKKPVTCYRHEPWHWRYVGRDTAAQVRASGLTLREWLWQQGSGQR